MTLAGRRLTESELAPQGPGEMKMYKVEVKAIGGWTTHSTHDSYRDAADQADMVRGRVACESGLSDEAAWKYAVANQGCDLTYTEWTAQDDDERAEYEAGAAGEATA